MHAFEIDTRNDSVRIWEEIERRGSQQAESILSTQPEMIMNQQVGTTAHRDARARQSRLNGVYSRFSGSNLPTIASLDSFPRSYVAHSEDNIHAKIDSADNTSRPEELREHGRNTAQGPSRTFRNAFGEFRAHHSVALSSPQLSKIEENAPGKIRGTFGSLNTMNGSPDQQNASNTLRDAIHEYHNINNLMLPLENQVCLYELDLADEISKCA